MPDSRLPKSVRVDGALNGAEVDGARLAPGRALDGDGVAEGIHRADKGDDDESREQRPEYAAEAQVETRVSAEVGQSDPGSVRDPLDRS